MTHFLKNTIAKTNKALNGMLEHWYQVCQILYVLLDPLNHNQINLSNQPSGYLVKLSNLR